MQYNGFKSGAKIYFQSINTYKMMGKHTAKFVPCVTEKCGIFTKILSLPLYMIKMTVFAYRVYHFIKSYIIRPSNDHIILCIILILHAWCALE